MKIDRRGKFVSMVGYISKYLSYTQSCVGCIGRLVYSSKTSLWGSPEYTEGSMRHCFTEKYYTSIILSFYTLRLSEYPRSNCESVLTMHPVMNVAGQFHV